MKRATTVRTARFLVEPLHFEHTVLGLAHQLAAVLGVKRVELDALTGHVDIYFDADATTHHRLERTICDCGYDVFKETPEPTWARSHRSRPQRSQLL